MKKISLSELQVNTVLEEDCYSEKGHLLLSKGTLLLENHIRSLKKRHILELIIHEEDRGVLNEDIKKFLDRSLSLDASGFPEESHACVDNSLQPINILPSEISFLPNSSRILKQTNSKPDGPALKEKTIQLKVYQRTDKYKTDVLNLYNEAIGNTGTLVQSIVDQEAIRPAQVHSIVEKFMRILVIDKDILLSIASLPSFDDYLYNHTVNVCLLSIVIATSYGYTGKQIVEIGIAALLHDIGMFCIPKEIRFKTEPLNQEDWFHIKNHPLIGEGLLRKLEFLRESTTLVCFQHHERENGSGYPKSRKSHLIHTFAKIIQIADIYEAMSTHRPYRSPFEPFYIMDTLIRMSQKGQICREILKYFLACCSVFPVGSYVLLSNNCIARVIHAHENNFSHPIVTVLSTPEKDILQACSMYQVDLSQSNEVEITGILNFQEYQHYSSLTGL